MLTLADLTFETIDQATDPVLDGFCCGKRGKRSEDEVHKIVADLQAGNRPHVEVRTMRETATNSLVGVVAVGRLPIFMRYRLRQFNHSPYITVIALSEHFRGPEHRGGNCTLGDYLLLDGLKAVRRKYGGLPNVFAAVDEANKDSMDLFRRHAFRIASRAPKPEADALLRRRQDFALRQLS